MSTSPEVLIRIAQLEQKVSALYRHLDIGEPGLEAGEVSPEVQQLVQQGKKLEAIQLHRRQAGLDLAVAKEVIERLEPLG